jgi:hypothetical protein
MSDVPVVVLLPKKRAPRPPKAKKETIKLSILESSEKTPLSGSEYIDIEALELKRCETTGVPEIQTISDLVSLPPDVKVNVVKVDQRTETARSGRVTRVPKPGKPGAPKASEVTSEDIKDKNPMAVRDQLMREYFMLRNQTDEVIQKLCVLIFRTKTHKE